MAASRPDLTTLARKYHGRFRVVVRGSYLSRRSFGRRLEMFPQPIFAGSASATLHAYGYARGWHWVQLMCGKHRRLHGNFPKLWYIGTISSETGFSRQVKRDVLIPTSRSLQRWEKRKVKRDTQEYRVTTSIHHWADPLSMTCRTFFLCGQAFGGRGTGAF